MRLCVHLEFSLVLVETETEDIQPRLNERT